MFKKLRIRLVFFNVVSIGLLLVLLLTGINLAVHLQTQDRNRKTLEFVSENEAISPLMTRQGRPPEDGEVRIRIARPGGQGLFPFMGPGVTAGWNCFFVKLDEKGEIFESSDNLSRLGDDTGELVGAILASGGKSGSFSYGSARIEYLVSGKEYGKFIAFLDNAGNIEMQGHMLRGSGALLLAGIFIVFLISLIWTSLAIKPMKKSWERQRRFTADASHELRTPLSVMRTNLDILIDNPLMDSAEQRKWLYNASDEVERMTELTESLLKLARYEDDGYPGLSTERFGLCEVIEYAVSAYSFRLEEKGVELVRDIGPEAEIEASKPDIRSLMVILVDNAVKYTPDGGRISISAHSDERHVRISVTNSGAHIEEKDLERIFDRFFRADDARSKTVAGFGLGLTIASMIVDMHKGKIEAFNTEDGVCFSVTLPKSAA